MLPNIRLFIHHSRGISLARNQARLNDQCDVHNDPLNRPSWLMAAVRHQGPQIVLLITVDINHVVLAPQEFYNPFKGDKSNFFF